ncbi:MAG TPA: PQQ-binding-like beta-propeller repeat protein [Vicinamibacterales bacterium]|nr:PQQ-binding-like beta-propeller repeat protein [Vicinamibacterales bacterium]
MTSEPRSLRLWPAAIIIVLQLIGMFVVPSLMEDAGPVPIMAVVAGGAMLLLWWLLASGAPWLERFAVLVPMALAVPVLPFLAHPSIAGAGQDMLIKILPVPLMMWGLAAWAALTRRSSTLTRVAALLVAIVVSCVPLLVTRTNGVGGSVGFDVRWRWTPTSEDLLLAQNEPDPPPPAAAPVAPVAPAPVAPDAPKPPEAPSPKAPEAPQALKAPVEQAVRAVPAEWPGFRGAERDGVAHGVLINTDWTTTPPVQMWRRAVGPGWSSFAVQGDLLYTQEQRGDDEIVGCYRVSTGEPVWRHRDPVRFYESNGGAGPRATPTLHGGRVYAHGATGMLNALDARTGKKLWSRDVAADTGRAVPEWGFASSPLIVDGIVVVAAAGTLAAYDLDTGAQRWKGPSYGGSYSSPHLATFDGVKHIILLGGPGVISMGVDGTKLFEYKWEPGPITQPAITADGDIIVNTIAMTGGMGTRRLHVSRGSNGWTLEERWTSNGLKPYFNDLVVHKGNAYGFDNNILSSINLETGARNWKGGRYGNGQMVLLADQDLLLLTSEDGEAVLVSAMPDAHKEIARFPVLSGKTWNHPVVVRDVLLVRNGEEMAAFRLSPAAQTAER